MTKKSIFLILFIPVFSIALEWKEFLNQSLTKSPQIQSILYDYEVLDAREKEFQFGLDWFLTVDVGLERDRQVSLTNTNFDLEESDLYSVNLRKSFLTGTDISFDLRSDKLESTATFLAAPRDGHFHSYLFTLEQNLWQNAFGAGLRKASQGVQLETKIQKFELAERIEESLISGSDLYWQAVLAYRRLIESEAALNRYESLYKNVQNKARVRYAAPGELAQVKAEFLSRQRLAKVNRIEYEQRMVNLRIFLPGMNNTGLSLPKESPKYSIEIKLNAKPVDQTRAYQLADYRRQQKSYEAESVSSLNQPRLAFVGQVGATGANISTSASQEQLIEGRRPYWYMGIRFSHSFGENVQDTRARKAKADALSQKIRSEMTINQLVEDLQLLTKNVEILEANLKVQQELLDSRRQAVNELTRTFNQGRTDISFLIESINRAEEAEVEQVRVRADLEMAYLRWLVLTDQLNLK
ncbi:MAG: TolC family protein [Bdellovibrionales bacterium]